MFVFFRFAKSIHVRSCHAVVRWTDYSIYYTRMYSIKFSAFMHIARVILLLLLLLLLLLRRTCECLRSLRYVLDSAERGPAPMHVDCMAIGFELMVWSGLLRDC